MLLSISLTILFIADFSTDLAYIYSTKGLDRVEFGQKIHDLRFWFFLTVIAPLLWEVGIAVKYCKSKGFGLQYMLTVIIARLINQEKCLTMPEKRKELRKYDEDQAKISASKKVKFIVLEDCF